MLPCPRPELVSLRRSTSSLVSLDASRACLFAAKDIAGATTHAPKNARGEHGDGTDASRPTFRRTRAGVAWVPLFRRERHFSRKRRFIPQRKAQTALSKKNSHSERRVLTAAMGDSEFDYSSDEFEGEVNTAAGGKVRDVSGRRPARVVATRVVADRSRTMCKTNLAVVPLCATLNPCPGSPLSRQRFSQNTGGPEPAARRRGRVGFGN